MMDLSKNRTKFPIVFENNWYSNWWPTKKKPSSYSGVSSESLGSHTSFWGDRHRRTGKPYGFPCPRRAEKVKSHRLSGGDQVTKINHTMRRGERRERRRRNQWRTERKQLGTWLPQDASIDGMQTVTVTDHVPIQVDSAGWGYLWSGWDGMITITIIASHRIASNGALECWDCVGDLAYTMRIVFQPLGQGKETRRLAPDGKAQWDADADGDAHSIGQSLDLFQDVVVGVDRDQQQEEEEE